MTTILTNIAYAAAGLIALPILAGLVVVSFIANLNYWIIEKIYDKLNEYEE
jgi:hypothetical protein